MFVIRITNHKKSHGFSVYQEKMDSIEKEFKYLIVEREGERSECKVL